MAADRSFKSTGSNAGHDGPTLPPAKGEMDELLDVCGRTPSATMKIQRSELDSLKMLAVSVAVPPDAFDEINARHRHLRVAPPSLPRMRSAEDGSVRNITVATKPVRRKRSPSAMELAPTLAGGPPPMQRAALTQRAGLRMRPAMMWLPALAVTFGIGAFATMSSSRATASTTEPVAVAAAGAAPVTAPGGLDAVPTKTTDDGTAKVNAIVRPSAPAAAPAAPVAGAGAPVIANAGDVLSPLFATGAPEVNPDDATSCESGADVGARASGKGDFEGAEAAYAKVLECNPHYLPARIGRADAAWDRGAHVRASLLYKRLVEDLQPSMYPERVALRALPQEPVAPAATAPAADEAPAAAPVGANE